MAEAVERQALERLHERRVRALLGTFRQLRHDLASPLSGAALHLEMASRRLAQRQDPELAKLTENVRVSQQEVAWAAGLLDLIGELARSADDLLVPFPLGEALRRGAGRQAARAARDGVRLEVPPGGDDAVVFGARDRLEQAFSDLTAHAMSGAGRGGTVGWSLDVRGATARASLEWPAAPDEKPERMFVLARHKPGDPPDASFFLARWAVESLGGTLKVEAVGERLRAVAALPKEEKRGETP